VSVIQNKSAGRTLLAMLIASFFIVIPQGEAFGSTSYETSQPVQESFLSQTGACCSGVDNYTEKTELIRLPVGTTFNNIQFSGTSTTGVYTYVWLRTDGATPFEDYLGTGSVEPITGSTLTSQLLNESLSMQVGTTNVIQSANFATTTITSSNQYIQIIFAGPASFSFGRQTQFDYGYSYKTNSSGPQFTMREGGTAKKFCLGTCSGSGFSPIPQVTAEPWARITSPTSGTVVVDSLPIQVQYNTGTSTVTHAVLRLTSSIQSIVPITSTTTATGINSFSHTFSLPAIEDTMLANITLYNGTSTVYVSPSYTFYNRTDVSSIIPPTAEQQSCDDLSGIGWALCSTMTFLFVPSQSSVDGFTETFSTLETKAPTVYLYQFTDVVNSLYTAPQLASSTISMDFAGLGTLDLISVAQLEAVPYTSWLYEVLGYVIYVMTALFFYRRALRIFNDNPQ